MKRNIFLADSTFFILLSKVDEQLIKTFSELYGVCANRENDEHSVYHEVAVKGIGKPGSRLLTELVNKKQIETLSTKNDDEADKIMKYTAKLSKEDARCVQICRENNLILITDNWHLIRIAETENVPVVTTFDVIKKLFVENKIDYKKAVESVKTIYRFGWYKFEVLEKVLYDLNNLNQ
jgi:predicted nucleic acid-binding protein